MFYNFILCRYHEIAIKGHNRNMFERCLMDNLTDLLHKNGVTTLAVRRVRGRIYLERKDNAAFNQSEFDNSKAALSKACGLESFSYAIKTKADIEELKKQVALVVPDLFAPYRQNTAKPTFRIRARRSDKSFPLRSREIEIALATVVGDCLGEDNIKVDLVNAQITIGCEVRDEFATLFFEEFRAPGGLPVGSNGAVMALLSGGIDSPVACYLALKRGCPVDYISFHSAPYTPEATTDKIRKMAHLLNAYQRGGRLILANLSEFQKLVRDNCTEKFRTVLYRRAMLRIAEKMARKYHRLALLTGDSVGQVASQTLENMVVIDHAVDMLILRPVVGMDKLDNIRLAEKIGTFELSCVQVPDSCTVFLPSQVATGSTVSQLELEEAKIADYDAVLEQIAEQAEIIAPDAL